jgi:hypothetical protein
VVQPAGLAGVTAKGLRDALDARRAHQAGSLLSPRVCLAPCTWPGRRQSSTSCCVMKRVVACCRPTSGTTLPRR